MRTAPLVARPVCDYVVRMLDLSPDQYRDLSADPPWKPRRGLAKWLHFVRHPVLAFITYQKAYPDDDDGAFAERQSNAILFGIGMFIIKRLHGG